MIMDGMKPYFMYDEYKTSLLNFNYDYNGCGAYSFSFLTMDENFAEEGFPIGLIIPKHISQIGNSPYIYLRKAISFMWMVKPFTLSGSSEIRYLIVRPDGTESIFLPTFSSGVYLCYETGENLFVQMYPESSNNVVYKIKATSGADYLFHPVPTNAASFASPFRILFPDGQFADISNADSEVSVLTQYAPYSQGGISYRGRFLFSQTDPNALESFVYSKRIKGEGENYEEIQLCEVLFTGALCASNFLTISFNRRSSLDLGSVLSNKWKVTYSGYDSSSDAVFDNIKGFLNPDSDFYNEVINACDSDVSDYGFTAYSKLRRKDGIDVVVSTVRSVAYSKSGYVLSCLDQTGRTKPDNKYVVLGKDISEGIPVARVLSIVYSAGNAKNFSYNSVGQFELVSGPFDFLPDSSFQRSIFPETVTASDFLLWNGASDSSCSDVAFPYCNINGLKSLTLEPGQILSINCLDARIIGDTPVTFSLFVCPIDLDNCDTVLTIKAEYYIGAALVDTVEGDILSSCLRAGVWCFSNVDLSSSVGGESMKVFIICSNGSTTCQLTLMQMIPHVFSQKFFYGNDGLVSSVKSGTFSTNYIRNKYGMILFSYGQNPSSEMTYENETDFVLSSNNEVWLPSVENCNESVPIGGSCESVLHRITSSSSSYQGISTQTNMSYSSDWLLKAASLTDSVGGTTDYLYYTDGSLKSLISSSGAALIKYDGFGRISEVAFGTQNEQKSINSASYLGEDLNSVSCGSMAYGFSYDNSGFLSEINSSTDVMESFSYLTSYPYAVACESHSGDGGQFLYSYDSNEMLSFVGFGPSGGSQPQIALFTYSSSGLKMNVVDFSSDRNSSLTYGNGGLISSTSLFLTSGTQIIDESYSYGSDATADIISWQPAESYGSGFSSFSSSCSAWGVGSRTFESGLSEIDGCFCSLFLCGTDLGGKGGVRISLTSGSQASELEMGSVKVLSALLAEYDITEVGSFSVSLSVYAPVPGFQLFLEKGGKRISINVLSDSTFAVSMTDDSSNVVSSCRTLPGWNFISVSASSSQSGTLLSICFNYESSTKLSFVNGILSSGTLSVIIGDGNQSHRVIATCLVINAFSLSIVQQHELRRLSFEYTREKSFSRSSVLRSCHSDYSWIKEGLGQNERLYPLSGTFACTDPFFRTKFAPSKRTLLKVRSGIRFSHMPYSGKIMFLADGDSVCFPGSRSSTKTICMTLYLFPGSDSSKRRYVFNQNNTWFGLSLYFVGTRLYASVIGTERDTGINVILGVPFKLAVSENQVASSDSTGTSYDVVYRMVVGSSQYSFSDQSIQNLVISAKLFLGVSGNEALNDPNPLLGLIGDLYLNDNFASFETLFNLCSKERTLGFFSFSDHFRRNAREESYGRAQSQPILSLQRSYFSPSSGKTTGLVSSESISPLSGNSIQLDYSYSLQGRLLSRAEQGSSSTYSYDSRGFLISSSLYGESFSYDSMGNMISKTGSGMTFTMSYSSSNPSLLVSMDSSDGSSASFAYFGGRLMTSVSIVSASGSTKSISMSYLRGMMSAWSDGTISCQFTYGASGLRTFKRVSLASLIKEENYIYAEGRLSCVKGIGYSLQITYGSSGTPLYLIKKVSSSVSVYRYMVDSSGLVIGIVNESGAVAARYHYSAFGDIFFSEDTDGSGINLLNPIRYKGYFYDEETGLYYCQTRYYCPKIARWMTSDSSEYLVLNVAGGINLFAYCGNDPVNKVDYTGHDWNSFWSDIGDWIEKTFGAFVDASYDKVIAGQDFFFYGWEEGIRIRTTIGDDSKPISAFFTNASNWWKICEYKVGLKLSIGKFSSSITIGLSELDFSYGWGGFEFETHMGLNKTGYTFSYTNNGMTSYSNYYIRTIPTVFVVVTIGQTIVVGFLSALAAALGLA